jgi:undecaprenyl-diphosphatase
VHSTAGHDCLLFFLNCSSDFANFTIVIQQFIIVVVLYFKRFFQTWDFYFKLFVTFIPAVVLDYCSAIPVDELLKTLSQ